MSMITVYVNYDTQRNNTSRKQVIRIIKIILKFFFYFKRASKMKIRENVILQNVQAFSSLFSL